MSEVDLTQWAQPTYVDDDFSTATPVGIPVFSSPIPATTDEYVFTQEYMQFRADFEPTPLNTPHDSAGEVPDYSNFVLVAEGPRQDIKGGIVRWQRTYATVPASWDDFASISYAFIGFEGVWITGSIGTASPVAVTGRERKPFVVDCRIRRDYFLVGPGGTYAVAGNIPSFKADRYVSGGLTPGIDVNFIMDAFSIFPATTPSRTTYNGWMANAAAHSWDAGWVSQVTPPPSNPGQLLAEDSRLSRWKGNIWEREMRFVLAA